MPGPYNTHVIVNVFRSIVQLISENPELLTTSGVFRIAGAKEETEKVLDQLIREQFNMEILRRYVMDNNEIDEQHLHNILGMIPVVFKDCKILDFEDKLLTDFSEDLKSLLDSPGEDLSKIAQLFDDFINALLLSNRIDHQRAGEILDHYCHLMHQAGTFQEANLMTYNNLAIIMAPRLTQDLNLCPETDFLALSGFISQLTPALEDYITEAKWDYNFKDRHADKLEHLANTRYALRERLEHMKEASRKVVVVPMKSLMLQAAMLKAQINSVEEQQEHCKRKEKKGLSKQLNQLKEELNELNLKISELTPQISRMNSGAQEIQEEINLISLSEDGVNTVRSNRKDKSGDSNLARFSIFESASSINTSTFLFPTPEGGEEVNEHDEVDYEEQANSRFFRSQINEKVPLRRC